MESDAEIEQRVLRGLYFCLRGLTVCTSLKPLKVRPIADPGDLTAIRQLQEYKMVHHQPPDAERLWYTFWNLGTLAKLSDSIASRLLSLISFS